MLTLARIETRAAQDYAFVSYTVPMDQMKAPADQGFPRLFSELGRQGIEPVGAPFYNYRRIAMEDTLDVEAGVPVGAVGAGANGVRFDRLPAGRYASVAWHGPFDGLIDATAMLIGWVRLVGERFDSHETAQGEHFACRLEIYETDPRTVPNSEDWVTTLAFKLAD